MTTPPVDRDLLAMEHALGLTPAEDLPEVSRLLAEDRDFAARAGYWQSRFLELDETAAETPPPADLWARIEGGLGAAQVSAAPARKPLAARAGGPASFWNSLSVWRWTAAAALLLLVLVTAAPPSQPVLIAVLTAESGAPGAIVEAYADGRVRLIPLQEIAVPEGRALQIWTLRDRNEGPVSVGLIDRARTVRLDLGALPLPGQGQLFEITIEPETGSPTGRPTGPIVMKGLTAGTL